MFLLHLRNELWKLFGKKRTYIGFGAFLLAQNAMLLGFKFTRWQSDVERLLAGNGYLASQYLSALTGQVTVAGKRSEEHTSELQSHSDLVCRLLLEKKKQKTKKNNQTQ